jgi:hypothetical protein
MVAPPENKSPGRITVADMRQGFVEVIGGTIYAFEDAAPEILNMTPANAMRHVGKTLDGEIEIDDSKLKSMDLTPREIEEVRVWHRQYCDQANRYSSLIQPISMLGAPSRGRLRPLRPRPRLPRNRMTSRSLCPAGRSLI